MSQAEARAWWADVEHLRERIERRRELEEAGHDGAARAPHPPRAASPKARRPAAEVVGPPPFRPRRTVRIRGQAIPSVTAPRLHPVDDERPLPAPDAPNRASRPARRRPRARPAERIGTNPDRLAMWAAILGVVLVLAALLSAHGV